MNHLKARSQSEFLELQLGDRKGTPLPPRDHPGTLLWEAGDGQGRSWNLLDLPPSSTSCWVAHANTFPNQDWSRSSQSSTTAFKPSVYPQTHLETL